MAEEKTTGDSRRAGCKLGVSKTTGKSAATVLVSMSSEEKKKLKLAAIERDVSMSALVREFIATL